MLAEEMCDKHQINKNNNLKAYLQWNKTNKVNLRKQLHIISRDLRHIKGNEYA